MDFDAFIKSLQSLPVPELTFSGLPGELTVLALATVLGAQQHVTRDLGGSAGTREMTRAIVENLK